MTIALYGLAKKKFLDGDLDLLLDDIKVVLVDTAGYTVNLATDEFLSSIPAADRIATTANLTSKDTTGGVFDAADTTFGTVSGDTSEAIVFYRDTGLDTTSPLIMYDDTATNLPITPNGGEITLTFSSGANKIFAL